MVATGTAHQPSLFGAQASDPTPADLVGLLAGPGQLQRMGDTARVSVTVEAGWRVHALIAEFHARQLPATWEPAEESVGKPAGFTVRTAYTTRLLPLARCWQAGPPAGLHLGGQALRLWVAAAGVPEPAGFLLTFGSAGVANDTGPATAAVAAALAAAGLTTAGLTTVAGLTTASAPGEAEPGVEAPRSGGRARLAGYRITGRRRLARLAELVGDPPESAPPGTWPATPPPYIPQTGINSL